MAKAVCIPILFALTIPISSAAFAIEPPDRFNHPPKIPIKVFEYSPAEVDRNCGAISGSHKGNTLACAIPFPHTCGIIWPKGKPRGGPWWRHEIAHCNGWPASHPR